MAAGSFNVQESTTANATGLGGPIATAIVTVNGGLNQPSVTNATTFDNTQTTSGLVITPNAADTAVVTYFEITNITGGTLYLNDGVTQVTEGEFITAAQGAAGLTFMPAPNSLASGSFTVEESTSSSAAGLGGPPAIATITVSAQVDLWGEKSPNAFTDGLAVFEEIVLGGNAQGSQISGFYPGATTQQIQNARQPTQRPVSGRRSRAFGESRILTRFTDGLTIFEDILLGGKAQASQIEGFFPGAPSSRFRTHLATLAYLYPTSSSPGFSPSVRPTPRPCWSSTLAARVWQGSSPATR